MGNARTMKPKTVRTDVGDVPLTPEGIPNLDAWVRPDIDRAPFRTVLNGKTWTFKHPKDLPISTLKMFLSGDPELSLAAIVCDEDRADMLLLDLTFGQMEVLGKLYEDHHGITVETVGNGSALPA